MAYINNSVQRHQVADFLNVTPMAETADYQLMGTGFTALNESPGAQVKESKYINNASSSKTTTKYQTQFPFNADFIQSEAAIKFLYSIARNQKTGGDAESDYIRVELFEPVSGEINTFAARKFHVSAEISSINDTDGNLELSGNLNNVGSFIDGKFNTVAKTFTPIDTAALGTLTITSVAGTAAGATKIAVAPALTSGNSYKYKTGVAVTMPALGQACTTGYTAWDGTAEITATSGNKIVVVEVDAANKAVKGGEATVLAKA